MTALEDPALVTVEDYLVGEETSDVKHEYLGGTVHAVAGATNQHNAIALNSLLSMGSQLRGKSCQPFNSDTKMPSLKVLIFVESQKPSVTLHRRKPGGGFAIERHIGLAAVIPLIEIDASLALAGLYDRAEFAQER